MPISYALLLGIPIGFFFFGVGRFCIRYATGRYDEPERRGAMTCGAFGVLLVPYIWTSGCLQEEFPNVPGTVIAILLLLAEGLALLVIFRPFSRRGMDKSGSKDRVES
jgi:hypothetical protein